MISAERYLSLINQGLFTPAPTPGPNMLEANQCDLPIDMLMCLSHPDREPSIITANDRSIPRGIDIPLCSTDETPGPHWQLTGPNAYLARTLYAVEMPPGYQGLIVPRSSAFRSGLSINGTTVPHGYVGRIFIGLWCPSAITITLGHLAALVSMVIFELGSGSAAAYDGIWSGEKAATAGTERPN